MTGATGFIGSHLCYALSRSSTEIHAITRAHAPDEPHGITWWEADLSDYGRTQEIVGAIRPEIVFHLASEVAGRREHDFVLPTFHSNLASTVNLLVATTEVGCRRFILTGSMEEPDSSNPGTIPGSPYAVAKWASSAYARMFHTLYDLPVVILRLSMVYGPGQRDLTKLVPYVILSLLREESPDFTSGDRETDWVCITDVVDAAMAAAVAPGIEGQTIDVGSGELVSVRTIVEELFRLMAAPIEPTFGKLPGRPMETSRRANIASAAELLGWKPKTDLEQGLRKTIEWYRSREATLG